MELCAASLNSGDAFVLKGSADLYVWRGTGCDDFELDQARNVMVRLEEDGVTRTVHEIEEGEENADSEAVRHAVLV